MAAEANRLEAECAQLWQQIEATNEAIGQLKHASARTRVQLQSRA